MKQAWEGIDPATVWDCHVHLAGLGDGGSGIEIGPQLSSPLQPVHYAQRLFYMNAGCAHDAPGAVDTAYVARLLNLCDAMPAGFKVMLFAFERFHDQGGRAHPEHSAFYVPNAWAAKLAREFPSRFEWVASLHPYHATAVDDLNQAISGGARAVKWLPAAQGMDPASARCDAFYRVLAESGVPLIVHCGEEKAVKGSDTQAFGNPLRLRRALDAGVKVVVAHCATMGNDFGHWHTKAISVVLPSLVRSVSRRSVWLLHGWKMNWVCSCSSAARALSVRVQWVAGWSSRRSMRLMRRKRSGRLLTAAGTSWTVRSGSA